MVYSYTVVHRAPGPAFAAEVPYVVAVVELAEGPHLMTNIVECVPDSVRIGMKVSVTYRQLADGVTLPVFEPKSIFTKPLAILCVPKKNPIVLASAMIEPQYTSAINNQKRYKP
jgi:DUF35 OB-fold domain, acyl-CoA-associated